MLPKRSLYISKNKKIFPKKYKVKKSILIYKKNIFLEGMRKKSENEIVPLQVDPINGEYYITIPEWMINDLSWYEDTQIKIVLDNNEILLSENVDD